MESKYMGSYETLCEYLIENYGFNEEYLEDIEYECYEEESWKRDLSCSGFIKHPTEDYYLLVNFTRSYDWGEDNYILYTQKYKKTQEVITKYIDVFEVIE